MACPSVRNQFIFRPPRSDLGRAYTAFYRIDYTVKGYTIEILPTRIFGLVIASRLHVVIVMSSDDVVDNGLRHAV